MDILKNKDSLTDSLINGWTVDTDKCRDGQIDIQTVSSTLAVKVNDNAKQFEELFCLKKFCSVRICYAKSHWSTLYMYFPFCPFQDTNTI